MDIASTQEIVIEVLQRASSQNPEILKPAEAKLKEWETQPGFYSALFNVLCNHSLDINVRWIAVLYIKNGIDRYWRRNLPNAISEQERQSIKQGLISDFSEPINQIAIQRAVLISKIARIDCPKEWPELFPTLLQALESSDSLIQHRAFLTLHHVVKAIASKRLLGDRRFFQEFTSNIYAFVLNLWDKFTSAFLNDIMQNSSNDQITSNLEKALLTLRVLRKLTVFGFSKPNQDCLKFLKVIFDRAKMALQCRKHVMGRDPYIVELLEKFIIHLTKVLISVLDTHPFSYIDFIQPCLEFTTYFLFTPDGIDFLFERFVIQCFNLIKIILLCAEYKPPKIVEACKDPDTLKAHEIKTRFFQANTLTEICRKLVSHYFILTQDELEMWDADPETFAIDEGGDSWKYSLRPCMETVFVTIFHEFRDTLAPVLLDMIHETNCIVLPEDMQGILRKDAVYNAVSLAAFDLYDEIDFDQWFTNTLTQELKMKHNNYRIIRRRVCSLVGRWTGIKLSSELRPTLYECVISLLGPDEDMAVRLTASSTLRYAIDDFEFNPEQFMKYLDTAFNLLFNLLTEANECETKMHVLNVMTLMVERVGQTIKPHTDALIHYLPLLWTESEDHNMLRCAIVSTLVQLVKALGSVSAELNPFLLPIIQLGTDTNQSAIVYLLEDCLELWLTVLENSTAMSNELLQLFNNMPTLLDYSTENLRLCLLISLVHTLLAPELVMKAQGLQLITVCDNLMADMKNEGIVMLIRMLEIFIRSSPSLGCETIYPILPRIFQKIYEGEDYPLLMSMYLCLTARVLLTSHPVFTRVLRTLSQLHNETDETVLGKILDIWLIKMPMTTQLEHRKLLGLALANLLTAQSRPVIERFRPIMVNILESLNDMEDSLLLTEGRSPNYFDQESDGYETDHDQRKKQLILSDPVHTIILKEYLQSQMYELRNQIGLEQYEQLLRTLGQETITQLKSYITL